MYCCAVRNSDIQITRRRLFEVSQSQSTMIIMFFQINISNTGHILRKVYNCRESKTVWPLLQTIFYHLISSKFRRPLISHWPRISPISTPKISDDLFIDRRNFFWPFFHHPLNIFSTFLGFSPLFSTIALPNLQQQLHNCHFATTDYILQLQKLSSVAR